MKFKDIYFLKSCVKVSDFPKYDYPEFAFIGRSNVGKSSLINMLLNRKNLVKTGSKPGVTTTINFFVIDDNTSIVDLPGYGYAKLPQKLKNTFPVLIKNYIKNRKNLRLVFLLIDIRRMPGEFERDMIPLLIDNRIPLVITLTKCDKLSKSQKKISSEKISKALSVDSEAVFITSAKTGEGKKDLLNLVKEFRNTQKE